MPLRIVVRIANWRSASCRNVLAQRRASFCALRTDFGDQLADQLLDISALQTKARQKFGEGIWWVTERSLQQATPWQVAALKATWMAEGIVYDLCCGVGGDAMQLALRGPVVAIDSDPVVAKMASANLAQAGTTAQRVQVICEDVLCGVRPQGCSLHIDPDRRSPRGRASAPELYQPAWHDVSRMIAAANSAVIKLAPAARIEVPLERSHRCWISLGGSVREQSLICGEAVDRAGADTETVSAVKVGHDGTCHRFAAPRPDPFDAAEDSGLQESLVDPDAAIRAAGLTEAFAEHHGLTSLSGPSGFLTGSAADAAKLCHLSVVGIVRWQGTADDRRIRRELRQRDWYPATIKVRGTDHDPAQLTKRYRTCGERPITLWIGRVRGRVFAAMTEPVPETIEHL